MFNHLSQESISPSTWKMGVCRITQPWPYYCNRKGETGRKHIGVDMCCGRKKDDSMLLVEDAIVKKIRHGSRKVSGKIELEGIHSGLKIVYRHLNKFESEVGDILEAGAIMGMPDYSNTRSKHCHFETWDISTDKEIGIDPILYLAKIQQDLRFEFSTYYDVEKWYKKNNIETYNVIKDRINRGENKW